MRDCPDIKKIVEKFNNESYDDLHAYSSTPGIVVFEGTAFCSYGRVHILQGIVAELVPYAVEPTFLKMETDSEREQYYIGPPGEKGKMLWSAEKLAEILELLQYLTPEDKEKLKEKL